MESVLNKGKLEFIKMYIQQQRDLVDNREYESVQCSPIRSKCHIVQNMKRKDGSSPNQSK